MLNNCIFLLKQLYLNFLHPYIFFIIYTYYKMLNNNFDRKYFTSKYSDLRGIKTQQLASKHWLNHSIHEGRLCNKDIEQKITKNVINNNIIIRFTGDIYSLTGYGTGCRNYLKHIMSLPNIDLYIEHMKELNDKPENYKDAEFIKYIRKAPNKIDYDIIVTSPQKNLQHNNAKYTIWCWYWEMLLLPESIIKFLKQNPHHIIVSPAKFMTEIIKSNNLINPCHVIKHWHLPNIIPKNKKNKENKENKEVVFYTIAQDVHRKNLELMFEAYLEEFTDHENIYFIAKISSHTRSLNILINQINNMKKTNSPKLDFITDFLTDEEMQVLHSTGDVFVLAQHSEGWGIPHIEALLSGNPLVTTNFGSLPDYANESNTFEIPYIESKIDKNSNRYKNDAIDFYPDKGKWAITTKNDIRKTMRDAYNNYKNKLPDLNLLTKFFSFDETLGDWETLLNIKNNTSEQIINNDKYILPKISLITSMFKGEKYLEQLMIDVTRQTIFKDNCEWIILDANPSNYKGKDYEIIMPYLDKYPNNIIYKKLDVDKGIYDTWNQGIKLSSGEFITNMNCDDRRKPDNLEKMAKFLLTNPDISLVYGDSYIVNEPNINWEMINHKTEKRYNMAEFSKSELLKFNFPHNNPVWRRTLHDKHGYFDPKYKSAGDAEFWKRCAWNGEIFKKYPNEILGIYYNNPDGMSTNKANIKSFINNEFILINKLYIL